MAMTKQLMMLCFVGIVLLSSTTYSAPSDFAQWPPLTNTMRPWAYWWWMGSAVDPENLEREMQRYQEAGLGGMHIIPIYGAKGFDAKYIEYLSPRWMTMLQTALKIARERGMDLDMTLGTGWCYGGPEVTADEANAQAVVQKFTVQAGTRLDEPIEVAGLQALMAFSPSGESISLMDRIGLDGRVDWQAEEGPWTVIAVGQRPSAQRVKRAAPGGAGYMLNPFYAKAIEHYLQRFTTAFDEHPGPLPRAIYHDSYEYSSEWSPDLLTEFEKRRGYPLQSQLNRLFGEDTDEQTLRVKCDYRETLSDMMVEQFMPPWVNWAQARGILTRDQAHGSPANLLDLYAQADIPETEMFSHDRDPLMAKMASSAAHVAGRQYIASETGTWLGEHFTVTLAQLKSLIDELFVSGINHVIYHGCSYSPDEAAWPGWLFYASTQMNPRNSIWHDVPALNAYIARCQSILQSGQPDNDLLVYWPIYDHWQDPQAQELVQRFVVHNAKEWLTGRSIGQTAGWLWEHGYAFDYVSDRQLADAQITATGIKLPGGEYRAIVVPSCRFMPVGTLRVLHDLARNGALVLFDGDLPEDVPGLYRLEERRAEFKQLAAALRPTQVEAGSLHLSRLGKGTVAVAGPRDEALRHFGIRRESMSDLTGIQWIRRQWESGNHYFISNQGPVALNQWIDLATTAGTVLGMDPMSGLIGELPTAPAQTGLTRVYLQLDPGASLILRTFHAEPPSVPRWETIRITGEPHPLTGTWAVEFLQGGPAHPRSFDTEELESWTVQDDSEAQRFAGTARYTLVFDAPGPAEYWRLDLGGVCQSARVRVNGQPQGTLLSPPYRLTLHGLKPRDNRLEVEVTNLTANRIRDLDRRGVPWRKFNEINFVNIDYKPFDASQWPLQDSGLLGPVTLTPAEILEPPR